MVTFRVLKECQAFQTNGSLDKWVTHIKCLVNCTMDGLDVTGLCPDRKVVKKISKAVLKDLKMEYNGLRLKDVIKDPDVDVHIVYSLQTNIQAYAAKAAQKKPSSKWWKDLIYNIILFGSFALFGFLVTLLVYGYVCASKTTALRRLLEAANSDTGFTNQEKDPEEFLNKLFQLLQVEPLLKTRSMTQQPQECHLYQLFPPTLPPSPSSPIPSSPVESPIPLSSPSSNRMRVASVQALLESSFLHARLKFVEAPSCLLLLMPRFGKDFKMFDAILPTLSLDITDLLDDTLIQCSICQAVAQWECLQCYEDLDITPGHLKQYCQTCNTQVHSHRKRASHSPVKIGVPGEPWTGPLHCTRQRMFLFAVTCIETSHYVSFIKFGPQSTDWLFFDSMADREGERC
ncbi:ubiquitin carboxyl-terminal hydrolase CYLD-like [Mastacembelus armatus]|uniref:ubiquitin carboxyl-terminal hydrolase CYLD-like n=1 Tax=Mastacembelus armatus TaxID=205130 RepID=UPI000E45FA22|nr:ubiquitin carboxyl-terminal hydrolase CYLD-like [Mastacembelus armatus]